LFHIYRVYFTLIYVDLNWNYNANLQNSLLAVYKVYFNRVCVIFVPFFVINCRVINFLHISWCFVKLIVIKMLV
jgi:hypothetical protein